MKAISENGFEDLLDEAIEKEVQKRIDEMFILYLVDGVCDELGEYNTWYLKMKKRHSKRVP